MFFLCKQRRSKRKRNNDHHLKRRSLYKAKIKKKKDCFYDGSSNCAFCLNNFKALVMQTTSKTLLDDY